MTSDKPLSLWAVLLIVVAGLLVFVLAWRLVTALRQFIFGHKGIFWTVYAWEHALLYVNGQFSRLLPPGRHLNFALGRKFDLHTLRRGDQLLIAAPQDVTSADKFIFRVAVTITYEVQDQRQAFEANDYDSHIRLAVTHAVIKLAAEHTLEAFLSERSVLDAKLLPMLPSLVAGCAIKAVTTTSVTLPPEIRRMFTEVERAKLEGLAALERARGEHAALRSLANAARMLKGNPELMNMRILQALSGSNGKRQPTLVLGQGALLPVGDNTDVPEEQ